MHTFFKTKETTFLKRSNIFGFHPTPHPPVLLILQHSLFDDTYFGRINIASPQTVIEPPPWEQYASKVNWADLKYETRLLFSGSVLHIEQMLQTLA